MTHARTPSKALNVTLWIVQILLAATLLWAAIVKLAKSPTELAAMWPWAGEVSSALVKLTGITDLLGGLGLILPALLRMKPDLTSAAALGIVILMICASVFHILREEASQIGFNIVVALLAGFVAWGRQKTKPIAR